jgi:hypothetical protein
MQTGYRVRPQRSILPMERQRLEWHAETAKLSGHARAAARSE